jgi:hypothetical protein
MGWVTVGLGHLLMNAENVVELPGTNSTTNQGAASGKAGTRTIVERDDLHEA